MTFEQAVAVVRTHQLVQEQTQEAITALLSDVVRYRQALRYYADPQNWLDAAPMLGDFAVNDEGHTARVALRLVDYVGEPLIPEEGNDENATGNTPAAA